MLGLAVAEQLYNLHPKASEGDLTLMKHRLVSTMMLAKVSKVICLGDYMRVGRGEEKPAADAKKRFWRIRSKPSSARFFRQRLCAGAFVCLPSLRRTISCRNAESSLDYKTLLQETLQAEKLAAPSYNLIKTDGPPHERQFLVEAVWKTGAVRGKGTSIKAAEMMAANLALRELKKENRK